MEDRDFLVERVVTDLNNSLMDACNVVIKNYDIPLFNGEKNPELALTILVCSASSSDHKPSKKKPKNAKVDVNIFYSLGLNFDVSYLSTLKTRPTKLTMLYTITEPSKYQTIYNRISYWSKALFKKVTALYAEYGLRLNTFPFEMYFDTDDTIYISKLPTFDDLVFFDKNDASKTLDKSVFIEKQVQGLLDAASSFQNH